LLTVSIVQALREPIRLSEDATRSSERGITKNFRVAFREDTRGGDEVDRAAYKEGGVLEANAQVGVA
jgi:hypothetical protein